MSGRKAALLVAALLGFAFLIFLGERIWFLSRAEKTNASVQSIQGEDRRCGRRKHRYDCSRFRATMFFESVTGTQVVTLPAGSVRGHGQPVTRADYRIGRQVALLYDRHNPKKAIPDTFLHIWGVTLFAGLGHGLILLRGLFGGRSEESS
jgi:hypothetical protein